MSDPTPQSSTGSRPAATSLSPADRQAALFAQLVGQQTSLVMMLLGQTAHPESGQVVRDLESAELFIDQLEMLEAKTKGNLTPPEAALLKQSLMALRLAFVKAVETPEPSAKPDASASPENKTAPGVDPGAAEDESRKRFSTKFSL